MGVRFSHPLFVEGWKCLGNKHFWLFVSLSVPYKSYINISLDFYMNGIAPAVLVIFFAKNAGSIPLTLPASIV